MAGNGIVDVMGHGNTVTVLDGTVHVYGESATVWVKGGDVDVHGENSSVDVSGGMATVMDSDCQRLHCGDDGDLYLPDNSSLE